MKSFFDDYPEYFTSLGRAAVPADQERPDILHPNRLLYRHDMMIQSISKRWEGANVLDLASHDGRWTTAAIKAGADRVTAVEHDPRAMKEAVRLWDLYGVWNQVTPVITRVESYLETSPRPEYHDIILNCGLLYHTVEHWRILKGCWRVLKPGGVLVIDTGIDERHPDELVMRMSDTGFFEPTHNGEPRQPVGVISLPLLKRFIEVLGGACSVLARTDTVNAPGLRDYAAGHRVTVLAFKPEA